MSDVDKLCEKYANTRSPAENVKLLIMIREAYLTGYYEAARIMSEKPQQGATHADTE